ncbi:MAG: phosphotransferase [Spirochaetes bacterium]|nr:phosphotransferase [Spirochaetota bacterium]
MDIGADESIRSFLKGALGGFSSLEPLAGDASTRRYWRVRMNGHTWVLCQDPAFAGVAETQYPFMVVYDLLKDSVPVPEIRAVDNGPGLLLIQDLGDDLLEYCYPLYDEDAMRRIYQTCVENLFSIQMIREKGSAPFSLSFNVEKLMFEFDFFIEHALGGYYRAPLSGHDRETLRSEFLSIAGSLDCPEHFVLAHRDYHSRNLIVFNDIPYIIDFQDARMGLPQYDLVSLLRDSYITLNEGVFEYLKNYYYEGGKEMDIHAMGRDEFNYYFDLMAFQRNVKALGTFGYQVSVKGNSRYERYFRPTADYLGDYAGRQEKLGGAWRILRNYLNGR